MMIKDPQKTLQKHSQIYCINPFTAMSLTRLQMWASLDQLVGDDWRHGKLMLAQFFSYQLRLRPK
jgi:hypothetical protein